MGTVFEVYREMGSGFLEAVFQECMEDELADRGIPFVAKPKLEIFYKGKKLKQTYEPDLVCYGKVIVELKAIKALEDAHRAQLHNYLKATGLPLGLLINFGTHPKVEHERIAMTKPAPPNLNS